MSALVWIIQIIKFHFYALFVEMLIFLLAISIGMMIEIILTGQNENLIEAAILYPSIQIIAVFNKAILLYYFFLYMLAFNKNMEFSQALILAITFHFLFSFTLSFITTGEALGLIKYLLKLKVFGISHIISSIASLIVLVMMKDKWLPTDN